MCVLTSTPGLSGGLVASLLAHGIRLTLVLGHSGVNGLNDIGSNGREEDLYNPNQLNSLRFPIPSRSPINMSFELVVPLGEGESNRWQSHRRTVW